MESWIEGALATTAGAVLIYFGSSLTPLWPLLWLAPLPVLVYALRARWWAAAVASFLAMLLGSLNMWHYAHVIPFPWFSSYIPMAVLFALAVLLFRALARRGAYASAVLAFPAVWVTGFYAFSFTGTSGTAGSLAYTQLNFLPMLQLASLTGPWGITFLLLLFPVALALGGRSRRVLAGALGVIAAALIFGAVRLARTPQQTRVKVAMLAADGNTAPAGEPALRLMGAYTARAELAAAQGARVILLPEKIAVFDSADGAALDTRLQGLADRAQGTVIAGFTVRAGGATYNQARIYAPGAPVRTYDKEHLLPFAQSFTTTGKTLTVLDRPGARWGVAICKDMDFAQPARRYGQAGIGLLLDPAWDFGLDRTWHGHIAVMRGVEDGFDIVHAAKDGWLTVSDTRGRILAQVASSAEPMTMLVAEAPVGHVGTLYQAWGDWFVWAAVAILLATLTQLRRRARVELPRPEAVSLGKTV